MGHLLPHLQLQLTLSPSSSANANLLDHIISFLPPCRSPDLVLTNGRSKNLPPTLLSAPGRMIEIYRIAKNVVLSVVDMIQSTATLSLNLGMDRCNLPLWLFLAAPNIKSSGTSLSCIWACYTGDHHSFCWVGCLIQSYLHLCHSDCKGTWHFHGSHIIPAAPFSARYIRLLFFLPARTNQSNSKWLTFCSLPSPQRRQDNRNQNFTCFALWFPVGH